MRSAEETAAIERMLKSHGLGTLEESGTVAALARLVDGHEHFMQLLRRLPPKEQREMYEAMVPHLLFPPRPLDQYVASAKQHAEAAQLPVINEYGNLEPYTIPAIYVRSLDQIMATCRKCQKWVLTLANSRAAAVHELRDAGWAYCEISRTFTCPECLDKTA